MTRHDVGVCRGTVSTAAYVALCVYQVSGAPLVTSPGGQSYELPQPENSRPSVVLFNEGVLEATLLQVCVCVRLHLHH